jgi:hypothetical protein
LLFTGRSGMLKSWGSGSHARPALVNRRALDRNARGAERCVVAFFRAILSIEASSDSAALAWVTLICIGVGGCAAVFVPACKPARWLR